MLPCSLVICLSFIPVRDLKAFSPAPLLSWEEASSSRLYYLYIWVANSIYLVMTERMQQSE